MSLCVGTSGRPRYVGACAAWGLDNNLTRKASDPLQIVALKALIAVPVNIAIGNRQPHDQVSLFLVGTRNRWECIAMKLASSWIAHFWHMKKLSH